MGGAVAIHLTWQLQRRCGAKLHPQRRLRFYHPLPPPFLAKDDADRHHEQSDGFTAKSPAAFAHFPSL
jgi:hypothetical protein